MPTFPFGSSVSPRLRRGLDPSSRSGLLPRRAWAVFAGISAFVLPVLAGAQTITLGTSVIRVDSSNKEDTSNRPSSTAQTITRADCEADQGYQFQVSTTGYTSSYSLQIWASRATSVDCRVAGNRVATSGQTQKCWRIYDGALSRVTPQTVNLRVRDIMANDVTQADTYVNAAKDTSVCGQAVDDTFKVSFLMLPASSASDAVAADDSFTRRVDTVGPDKVTGVSASAGEGRLLVTWDSVTSGSELTGYNLYCADATSTIPIGTADGGEDSATTEDAGSATDATVDDAGSVQDTGTATTEDGGVAACGANAALVEGAVPTSPLPDGVWLCGSVNSSTATGAAATTGRDGKPLVNGAKIWVAVAAVDQAGNIGPLSAAGCGVPQLVDDFYETYVADGGTAGCSMQASIGGAGASVSALVGLALLIGRRRNRRSAPETQGAETQKAGK